MAIATQKCYEYLEHKTQTPSAGVEIPLILMFFMNPVVSSKSDIATNSLIKLNSIKFPCKNLDLLRYFDQW